MTSPSLERRQGDLLLDAINGQQLVQRPDHVDLARARSTSGALAVSELGARLEDLAHFHC